MPERRNTPSGILHQNKNSRRMKKKIYQYPEVEVVNMDAECQLMAASDPLNYGGSSDDDEWDDEEFIWAE